MTFEQVRLTNATVASMIDAGRTEKEIICQLVEINTSLVKELMDLSAIAPKKIRTQGGKIFVWQCPIDLIPTTQL